MTFAKKHYRVSPSQAAGLHQSVYIWLLSWCSRKVLTALQPVTKPAAGHYVSTA